MLYDEPGVLEKSEKQNTEPEQQDEQHRHTLQTDDLFKESVGTGLGSIRVPTQKLHKPKKRPSNA